MLISEVRSGRVVGSVVELVMIGEMRGPGAF